MLRRAENVSIRHQPSMLTGKGPYFLQVGTKSYRVGKVKISKPEFHAYVAQQVLFPVRWARLGDRSYYQFSGKFYWDNDDLTAEQVHALLVTRQQAHQRKIDRATAMVAAGGTRLPTQRGHIADDVKQFVWMRDQGTCRHCGSTTELQYDHIIPVAMGGSSEQENLQILCGPCNRRKSAGLTVDGSAAVVSQAQSNAAPPAGWYPNPSGTGQRFWDGSSWTEHTHG